ncbi:MAG: hypothetical protein K2X77_06225 [Candidatus Obscuribacterales bacterium]|nr:hypothetical protein [Candidatus Obscuribacterales bacterium]
MRSFPARLVDQPIFYPVTNKEYATQIALDWNTRRSGSGYVLSFEIADSYADKFERKIVGASAHEELWVPAELLPDFNANLSTNIELDSAYFSDDFEGFLAPTPSFGGLHEAFHSGNARSQLIALSSPELRDRLDEVIQVYNTGIFLSYPYWCALNRTDFLATQKSILDELHKLWLKSFSIPLCPGGQLETE